MHSKRDRSGIEKHRRSPALTMTTMDLSIHTTPLPHTDPEASLAFYRDVLGFEVRKDVGSGEMRWITVGPPGQPGTSILLAPPAADPSITDDERATARQPLKMETRVIRPRLPEHDEEGILDSATKSTRKPATSTGKASSGLTEEERAAMGEYGKEVDAIINKSGDWRGETLSRLRGIASGRWTARSRGSEAGRSPPGQRECLCGLSTASYAPAKCSRTPYG